MSTLINTHQNRSEFAHSLNQFADHAVRFSIVIVLAWIGAMKFTSYEAGAIEGLVASSPLTSWLYSVFSLQGASNLIGFVEVATAVELLLAPVSSWFCDTWSCQRNIDLCCDNQLLVYCPNC